MAMALSPPSPWCFSKTKEKSFKCRRTSGSPCSNSLQGNANQNTTKSSRLADCTFLAQNATKRGASTTSCAAAQGARAIPALRDFFSRRRFDAHLRRRTHQGADVPPGHDRRRADRIEDDLEPHRESPAIGRSTKFRCPQTFARVRRCDEQTARNDLRDSPLRAGRQRPARLCPGNRGRRGARTR